MKKLLLATLAGTATMLVLSFLFHKVLMHDTLTHLMEAFPNSSEPSPIMGLVMTVVVVFIMAYMYPKGYEGGSPFVEGLKFGGPIGLLLVLPLNFILVFALGADADFSKFDVPWHVIEEGLVGGVIGLVYGKGVKKA